MVLVVLLMLVLLSAVALVIDAGYAFAQRRFMQNAADAGALSAAIIIAKGEYRDVVVRATAAEYAQYNRATTAALTYLDAAGAALPNPTDGVVPANAVSVRVVAGTTFPTFLAQVVGFGNLTVAAQSNARATASAMPTAMPALSPLSVPINFYEECASSDSRCDIWDSQFGKVWGIKASQYKSLIDLSNGTAGGSISQHVRDWTRYGYPGVVESDTWLPTINGDHGNNVAGALRDRILANPAGVDPDGVIWGTIDMCIWDAYVDRTVHVVKFGRFKVRLTDVYGSRAYGHFIDWVVPGHERGPDTPAGPILIILDE